MFKAINRSRVSTYNFNVKASPLVWIGGVFDYNCSWCSMKYNEHILRNFEIC